MATVPYPPGGGQQVMPSEGAIPYSGGVGNTPEAFGSGFAQALGQTGEMLAKHAVAFKDRENTTEETELFLKATIEQGERTLKFDQLKGKARYDGLKQYTDDILAIQKKYGDMASNAAVRQAFENDYKRRAGFTINSESIKAGTELQHYQVETAQSRSKLADRDIATYATDDKVVESAIKQKMIAVDDEAKVRGWGKDTIDEKKKEAVSNAWKERLEPLSDFDPLRADKLYKDNVANGNITGDNVAHLRKKIDDAIVNRQSTIWVRGKMSGTGKMSEFFIERKQPGANWRPEGMNPVFLQRARSMLEKGEEETGEKAVFTSIHRTKEEQQRIWDDPSIPVKARPGTSQHEFGNAMDLQKGKLLDWVHANAHKYGLQVLKDPRDRGHVMLSDKEPEPGALRDFPDSAPLTGRTNTGQLADLMLEAEADSKKVFPNDPIKQAELYNQKVSKLRGQWSIMRDAARDGDLALRNIVHSELDDPNKKIVHESQLSQNGQGAFEKMTEPEQFNARQRMKRNALRDNIPTPETKKLVAEVLGMRGTHQDDEFLAFKFYSDPRFEHLTMDQKKELTAAQRSHADVVAVGRKMEAPMRIMGGLLKAEQIYEERGDTRPNTLNNRFRGAFGIRLDAAVKEKGGKPLNEDEIRAVGSKLLQEMVIEEGTKLPGWLPKIGGWEIPYTNTKRFEFEFLAPETEEELDEWRKKGYLKKGDFFIHPKTKERREIMKNYGEE